MSTHNICFYGELEKIIPDLSPNTPFSTLLLLNMTYPVLANSVDPDQLASEELHGLSLNMWISIKNLDQVIWLAGS